MQRLRLCFGVHNHQPVGNFESVLQEATERASGPFLPRVRVHPDARLTDVSIVTAIAVHGRNP